DDPRGLRLAWDALSPTELVRLLDDPRFAVRDRAIEELAGRDRQSLAPLEKALLTQKSSRLCRNAVWALTRIHGPEARRIIRPMIKDADLSVKLAAIHSAGLHRDARAVSSLLQVVEKDDPAVRRQAATALGRIRDPQAVPAIMAAIKEGTDRFL